MSTYMGSVLIGSEQFNLFDEDDGRLQFYTSDTGSPTGVYVGDHVFVDANGKPIPGTSWDDQGNVSYGGVAGTFTSDPAIPPAAPPPAAPPPAAPPPAPATPPTPESTQHKGTITIINPNGSTAIGYMTYDGRIVDENGKTIMKYSQTGDYDYTLMDLNGNVTGSYNTQTGTVTYNDGSTAQAHYAPTGVNIPPYGDLTSTSEGSRTETLTTDRTGRTDTSTGIDWSSPVASALLPSITESALAMPGLAKTAGTQAQEGYLNLMNQAMGPQNFQGYLNTLASRGILDSSLTGSTLANAQQQAAQAVASKAFDASLANTMAQMQVPGYLGSLTSQLGGTAGTTTTGETGTATTTGTQAEKKTIQDPLRPYQTYLNFLNL